MIGNSPIRKMMLIYLLYPAWIVAWARFNGTDYNDLANRDVILTSLVLPMASGALLMVGAISWLGWWRPVLKEERRDSPRWVAWPLMLLMLAFVGLNAVTTDWTALGADHLALLVIATLLVGFNEEALCRGVLVTGLRQGRFSEAKVWFLSSLMFGMLHMVNVFSGMGFGGTVSQVFSAFLGGTAYYILRRASGSLVLPILFHAAWDFSILTQQASGAPAALFPDLVLDFGIGFLALALVYFVVRKKPDEDKAAA